MGARKPRQNVGRLQRKRLEIPSTKRFGVELGSAKPKIDQGKPEAPRRATWLKEWLCLLGGFCGVVEKAPHLQRGTNRV